MAALAGSPPDTADRGPWDEFLPGCRADQAGRNVARFSGEICAVQRFVQDFGPGFHFALEPIETGWHISIRQKDELEL